MIRPKSTMLGALCVAAVSAASIAGCRGGVSEDPPINLAPDMDLQAHRRPQSPSKIFADGRAARMPVEHTVARGHLKTDSALYRGVDVNGKPVARIPFEVTPETLERGEERYDIYCAPCHDKTGSGNGAVPRRLQGTSDQAAFSDIPSYALGRLKDAPDGEIFQTISQGKGRMPSYAAQIPEQDRWAIIAWVRVLQNILPPATAPSQGAQGATPAPSTSASATASAAPSASASASAAPSAEPSASVSASAAPSADASSFASAASATASASAAPAASASAAAPASASASAPKPKGGAQ